MAQSSGSPTALGPRCPGCGAGMLVAPIDLSEHHPDDVVDDALVDLLAFHEADELVVELEHCSCGRRRLAVQHLIPAPGAHRIG